MVNRSIRCTVSAIWICISLYGIWTNMNLSIALRISIHFKQHSDERWKVWVLCCLMTRGLSKGLWCHVYCDHAHFYACKSDVRPHAKWAVNLVADGYLIFLKGLHGLIYSLDHPWWYYNEGLARWTNGQMLLAFWTMACFEKVEKWYFLGLTFTGYLFKLHDIFLSSPGCTQSNNNAHSLLYLVLYIKLT